MNTSRAGHAIGVYFRHGGHVDDEVSNLAEEVVLVGIEVDTRAVRVRNAWNVWVGIDQGNALESRRPLDDWEVDSITNNLSVVWHNDGLGDDVGTGRKVDDGRLGSRRVASLTAAAISKHGLVDGGGVVGRAIALGTKIHDIAEDTIVVSVVRRDCALTSDLSHPVRGRTGGGRICLGRGSSHEADKKGGEDGNEEAESSHVCGILQMTE